jgi:hypothetical protein
MWANKGGCHMGVDPEEELAENIRRFPENYPKSIGGLRTDSEQVSSHKDYADRAIAQGLEPEPSEEDYEDERHR